MKIKLTGALSRPLTDMGLKPGDIYHADPAEHSRLGAVVIKIHAEDHTEIATVFPENFIKL